MDVEAVKQKGVRTALFEAVLDRLWSAKVSIEAARETQNGDIPHFSARVLAAKLAIADAEAVYAEFVKLQGGRL